MITISPSKKPSVEELAVEMVERKGLGHPDTLIDGMMEEISRKLCKYYLDNFGKILHHNVDKGVIAGGEVKVEFGGGEMIKPIFALLVGRATDTAGEKKIPVIPLSLKAAKDYVKRTLRNLDVETQMIVDAKMGRGSADLTELFKRKKDIPLANDTSFGVGYAPYSTLESLVLNTEKFLNSKSYKEKNPFVGEDIKVMGLREGKKIRLTVAVALIAKHVHSLDDYIEKKNRIKEDVEKLANEILSRQEKDYEVEVNVNTADNEEKGSVYITLTGTSAEMGDDGQVGRGNRVNGLITPMRNMSLEAAAGKNPISHVGKIYNVWAFYVANQIVEEIENVEEATIMILSQIGKPITQPQSVSVEVRGKEIPQNEVEYIVEKNLEDMSFITEGIVKGKFLVF